jgi:hypothetical protein
MVSACDHAPTDVRGAPMIKESFAISAAALFLSACGSSNTTPPESPTPAASEGPAPSGGAAASGATAASGAPAAAPSHAEPGADQVKCLGVNECSGKGACHMPTHECAGQNECRGKGWVLASAADCTARGGTIKP